MLYEQKASGNLEKLFHDRIRRARRWAATPRERDLDEKRPRFRQIEGEQDGGLEVGDASLLTRGGGRFLLHQGSASSLPLPDNSVDFIVTDPPYYDNVQYSDLAAFFHVWLRRLVPDAANWEYDPNQSAVMLSGNSEGQYAEGLARIIIECRRVLKVDNGRLIMTFHHWKAAAWAALTVALQRGRFHLANRYVVHAENPTSLHIANSRALTHDAILVLALQNKVGRPIWDPPLKIDRRESRRFCRQCATLLGWLLDQEMAAETVYAHWHRALRP